MAEKFIQGAIKHPGALRRELKTPKGKTIPATLLEKKESPLEEKVERGEKLTASERLLKQRIDLAQTLGKFSRAKARRR